MKVLALVGSQRKNGNTARIVRMVEACLQALADDNKVLIGFEILYLGDFEIRPCSGCRACFDRGEAACPLKDDSTFIFAKMANADALILASPVYVQDVSGLMKNLLDRLAYLSHRPALADKYACMLATVGGGNSGHTLRTMHVALLTWGCQLLGRTGFKMGALAKDDELLQYQAAAATVARKIYSALAKGPVIHPSFISLMAFRIQQLVWQREAADSYDYTYWKSMGWLDIRCTYYLPHRTNAVKGGLARMVGAIVYRLVV
jgi:multimeric flavodoxin WrbA